MSNELPHRRFALRKKENAGKLLRNPGNNHSVAGIYDGMLEYADPRDLTDEITRIIR